MFLFLRLSTCLEFYGFQNDMIVFNTKDIGSKPQWDIKKDKYYFIHDCQFNDTGDYGGKSSIDFQNGDGSQLIDVYSCIITYGKGYYGGGIYFWGNFDFNIKYICIYSGKCKLGYAIAYLDGGKNNKFNVTYLSSSYCLMHYDPLYMKYFQEYSNSNVSFTPAYARSGIVCVESEYENLKIDYNSFYNNTCPQYIVYFYTSKYNTISSNCNVINNQIDSESVIVYKQTWSSISLYLLNFYIYGNQGRYSYLTYKTLSSGKIFVENCSADSHKFQNYVYFTGDIINVTEDEHPIYPYYGTFACDALWPINVGEDSQNALETPYITPFETAHDTPFETPYITPFETAHDTPFETPYITPFETAQNTPFETPYITPFETAHDIPFETPYITPFETAHDTPFETPYITPFETAHDTPFETVLKTPIMTMNQFHGEFPPRKTPNETYIETNYESSFKESKIQEGVNEKDHVSKYSYSSFSSSNSNVIDISNHDINESSDFNDPNKLKKSTWVIIAASLSAFLISIIVVSIYLYIRKISQQNGSESEFEMVEETVISLKDNISLTIENPLFTTTINGSDDPFKSAFDDSETEGVFYIHEN